LANKEKNRKKNMLYYFSKFILEKKVSNIMEANLRKSKKSKKNTSPLLLTKNISISLPAHLIHKINQMELSGQGVNMSKTIRFILEDYFEASENGKVFQSLQKDHILVPVDLYAELKSIGKVTIKSRALKGELELVSLYGNEYVQLSKDDPLNIYAQTQTCRDEVSAMQKQVNEIMENYEEIFKELKSIKNSK